MIDGNWLLGYGSLGGLQRALSGMSKRTPYVSRMDEATQELREHYPLFLEEFMSFFPQLKSFSEGLIRARKGSD
jgi:acyl carrier protein phosphodiesterase